VQQDWLHTFNDPQLDALVQEAIAHNPDLRVAGARVEQAAQSLIIAQSALRPQLGIFGTGGGKTGGGGDSSSALQAIMLFASWELDLWGRVRYARNAAEQDLLSVQADLNFARQSLAASVAKAWFTATQLTLNAGIATDMVRSTHFLRVIRAVMLKGGDIADVAAECGALVIILVVISTAAMHRYRQTLD